MTLIVQEGLSKQVIGMKKIFTLNGGYCHAAGKDRIFQSQLKWIHTQFFSDHIHHRLYEKHGLGAPEAAHGSGGGYIRVDTCP